VSRSFDLDFLVDKKVIICYNIVMIGNEEKVIVPEVEEAKKRYTKEHPHETGAYWDPIQLRWLGYKARAGFAPPWLPFNAKHRKKKVTINEKKFLMILSQTGSLAEAYRATYKFTPYPDKRIEAARATAQGTTILKRVKEKAPELVAAFTFDDITPEFIKREMLKLYNNDHATIGEKTRLVELMGKTQAIFKESVITDQKIREIVEPVYKEVDTDFPDKIDKRKNRLEIEVIGTA